MLASHSDSGSLSLRDCLGLGLTLERELQSNVVTERIIRAGGGEPLTKTIITIPPSQPSQMVAPQSSSWTTVDIDIDSEQQSSPVEVHHVKIRPRPGCCPELGLELEGGRREGIFLSEVLPGGLAAGLSYPGLRQGPVRPASRAGD